MNEQFITAIRPIELWGADRADSTPKVSGQSGADTFKKIFGDAITNVRNTDEELTNKQYQLATGEIDNPHSVSVAAAQAQLSVELLVSLRNKALESYNELLRINL